MEQKSLFTHDVPKNFLELWTLTDAMGELWVLVGDGDGMACGWWRKIKLHSKLKRKIWR